MGKTGPVGGQGNPGKAGLQGLPGIPGPAVSSVPLIVDAFSLLKLEVCMGFKLKPEPDPTRAAQPIANLKKDAVFHDCMQRSVNK